MITKALRRALKRAVKQYEPRGMTRGIDYRINDKAGWKAAIDACTVNGKIGVIQSGMDCDCSKYRREYVVDAPLSVVAWLREYDDHCQWLDGPESLWFVKPHEVRDGHYESRDLALEAFEDGHQHIVYS